LEMHLQASYCGDQVLANCQNETNVMECYQETCYRILSRPSENNNSEKMIIQAETNNAVHPLRMCTYYQGIVTMLLEQGMNR
jgi:hypothetical protein